MKYETITIVIHYKKENNFLSYRITTGIRIDRRRNVDMEKVMVCLIKTFLESDIYDLFEQLSLEYILMIEPGFYVRIYNCDFEFISLLECGLLWDTANFVIDFGDNTTNFKIKANVFFNGSIETNTKLILIKNLSLKRIMTNNIISLAIYQSQLLDKKL